MGQSAPARAEGLLELNIGIHRIHAEVANTPSSRSQGLMYRKQLPTNHGMLFVFVQPAVQCMWMRNTLIPLSVAFMDAQGRIINIEEMQPQTEDQHCAGQPAKYALEMPGGWFVQRGIKAGMPIDGVDGASAGF
ncbi:DUF192 domain-containing protein [Sterolibacterium denitrificans]|uniref:DUF192 domain-containing protein n=1 Tax=Sterolibacterium denitrificans TaxID=157592 RepID=UPI001E65AF55|nr:DUF192 domain-containing protein [Sterolibacterium denitrificans]